MTNLKIKVKTIAQFKIMNYIENYFPKLLDNLISIELINKNEIKIKDKNEVAYITYDECTHEIIIFDEKKKICRKEHI